MHNLDERGRAVAMTPEPDNYREPGHELALGSGASPAQLPDELRSIPTRAGDMIATWLAKLRADAAALDTVFVVVGGPAGTVAIPPEDIRGKSDDELLALVASRLAKP